MHEVRTADGRALKVTEPRAAGAQPRAPGSAVRVQTVGAERHQRISRRGMTIKEQNA